MKTIKKNIYVSSKYYELPIPSIKELIDRSINGENVTVQLKAKTDEPFQICIDYDMIGEPENTIKAAITFESKDLYFSYQSYAAQMKSKGLKPVWNGTVTNIELDEDSSFDIEVTIPLPWGEEENKNTIPKKVIRFKEYTAKFRITPKREPDLEYLMESYEEGQTDLIDLFVEDEETGEVIVSYDALDYKINDRFYDVDFCRGYEKFQDKLVSEGKLCYICQPQITGMREEGNFLMVDLAIPMPWAEDTNISGVPAVPEKEQVYSLLEGEPMNVVCNIHIVGVKYHVDKKNCKELEEDVVQMETVVLKAEPENPYDKNAIAVYLPNERKIGYIPTEEIPTVRSIMKDEEEEVSATLNVITYQEDVISSISISINTTLPVPLEEYSLFSQYTPLEVYRANYAHRYWKGQTLPEEEGLFDSDQQIMHFEKLAKLPIDTRNNLASEWMYRMNKIQVDNPTKEGRKMSVPLDLSVYGTSWKDLDLAEVLKLKLIKLESDIVAMYISMRRMEDNRMAPDEFIEKFFDENDINETLMARLRDIHAHRQL